MKSPRSGASALSTQADKKYLTHSTMLVVGRYALDATKRASIYKAQTRFNQIAGIMLPPATRRLYRCDAGAEFDFAVWMDYVASNERAVLSTLDILATSPECVLAGTRLRVADAPPCAGGITSNARCASCLRLARLLVIS